MFLLFDIGGTYMRIGISKKGTRIDDYQTTHTPRAFDAGMDLFKKRALEMTKGTISEIAGGIAGPLNASRSQVDTAPHLKGWCNKPLKASLQRLTKGDVYIENDAALAGLGEAHYGAGRGKRIVMYYTVGTGVGGARIVDGHIDAGLRGFEPGHQIIAYVQSLPGKTAHTIKRPQFLEEVVSGSGLAMRYQTDPEQITSEAVWKQVVESLALGLHNSLLHWSPEVVVLGGGMILNNAISLDAVRKALKKIFTIYRTVPPIKKAQLKDSSCLYGALVYLKQHR